MHRQNNESGIAHQHELKLHLHVHQNSMVAENISSTPFTAAVWRDQDLF